MQHNTFIDCGCSCQQSADRHGLTEILALMIEFSPVTTYNPFEFLWFRPHDHLLCKPHLGLITHQIGTTSGKSDRCMF